MASGFSETQLLQLVRITRVDRPTLENILDLYDAEITAETETQVGALILEYFPASGTGAGRNFIGLNGAEQAFGAFQAVGVHAAKIRQEIIDLLFLNEITMSSGSRLVRS